MDLLNSSFFINALTACAFFSVAGGILAPLMLINRLFSTAGALTHAAFGGVGLSFYFALPLFATNSAFCAFLGLILAHFSWQNDSHIERLSGVLWSFGMAFGLVLIDLTPSYHPSIESFLFGNILTIASFDLWAMGAVSLIFVVLTCLFYTQLELLSFDKELAFLRGLKPLYILLLLMLCFCISVSMKLLGLILMMGLLSIPVLIAKHYAKSLLTLMLFCIVLTFFFCVLGLVFSFYFNTLSAPSIVLIAAAFLALFNLIKKVKTF